MDRSSSRSTSSTVVPASPAEHTPLLDSASDRTLRARAAESESEWDATAPMGMPLAHGLPEREVVLLDAERRKCLFLEGVAPANARVVWGRAEAQETDWAGVAVAKALAPPPTAAEWCLLLVRSGGAVVLWVGPSADAERVARVAERIGGELAPSPNGFIVLRKLAATPAGFPRRPGIAKKRPLA